MASVPEKRVLKTVKETINLVNVKWALLKKELPID